jgi:membrane protease YdiL (CAAX protease family)
VSALSIALLLSVPTLVAPPLWLPAAVAVVVAGYATGVLHGPAVLWLAALGACAWRLRFSRGWSRAGWIGATAALGLLLGVHDLPGFSNPIVIRDAVLARDAVPYTQYVNFDKTLGGLLLLGCSGWAPMRTLSEWRAALRRAVPVTVATVALVLAASLALGHLRWEPRWSPLFWIWASINLFSTCVSEEAFFRGLVQTEVRRALSVRTRHAASLAILGSAALFGLAHTAGGWRYVVLASLAGVGYALTLHRTARLEMSILTHFMVNAVHFLAFTYPALAGSQG